MPFYQEQLLPRIQNRIMDNRYMRERRRRVCAGLAGDVIELETLYEKGTPKALGYQFEGRARNPVLPTTPARATETNRASSDARTKETV